MRMAPGLSSLWVAVILSVGVAVIAGSDPGASAAPGLAQQGDYASIRQSAERHYAEGSYSRARELYEQASALEELDESQRRWVAFRLADSAWRAAAASRSADTSELDAARRQLEALIGATGREQNRDLVWAEAHESLGDSRWAAERGHQWEQAWSHYEPALEWWANSAQIDAARGRYLNMVWTIAGPLAQTTYAHLRFGAYLPFGDSPPLQILENAARIATNSSDRARAHLLAALMVPESDSGEAGRSQQHIVPQFEAALEASVSTPWRDDVLYRFGRWMAERGRVVRQEDGEWEYQPDLVRGVELLRTLVHEYSKGETPYYDDALTWIDKIAGPTVNLSTSNFFLPGSEIELQLNWSNVGKVDLKLYAIDLYRSPDFTRFARWNSANWLETIALDGLQPMRSWSVATEDSGKHEPGHQPIRITGSLPLGAYVLEGVQAEPGAHKPARSREVVLVTDAALVLKRAGKQALIYFCDTFAGAPLAGADVALWERRRVRLDREWVWTWTQHTGITGEDGIAVFELNGTGDLFAAAARDGQQAFSTSRSSNRHSPRHPWRVYAFTDRGAYRPGEKARWKLIARRHDGNTYTTPASETLWYEIHDPRGVKVDGKLVTLNAFGSAWGELQLSPSMPLGQYRVSFKSAEDGWRIGSATLFRLEEYKLPEFRVKVSTPEHADGKKKTFRLGDPVEVNIQAEYYSGGAVTEATVEVLVFRKTFRHSWHPPREFAWYYEDSDTNYGDFGYGDVIERRTLSVDSDGRATITFKTPAGGTQDFQYRIQARVTDASRREIVGTDTVRVTRQLTFVYARPRHYLVQPQDTVRIDFNALDANNQPLSVRGIVEVTRDTWHEVWVDSLGNQVTGTALRQLRREHPMFPRVGDRMWRLKSRGYEHEDVLSVPISTNQEGEAEFTFTPERDGYYSVTFAGREQDGTPIVASTSVWAANNLSTELGYRHGGLGIIVDKDTLGVGQTAVVMLTVPSSDRYVLFSVSGDDLYSYQLVHLTGTAKLVQLQLQEKHVPNIYLGATMVAGHRIYKAVQQLVVPPRRNFLQVQVQADAQQFQPGEQGELTVRVHDDQGRPVVAEVALALVDEATFYIQQEYAVDPRQYFFGEKRRELAETSSFQHKLYVELVEMGDGRLLGRREISRRTAADEWEYDGAGLTDMSAPGAEAMYYDLSLDSVREVGYITVSGSATVVKHYKLARPSADGAYAGAYAAGEPAVQVRSDFRATALWVPDLITGADGTATIKVTYPDSLTSWRATARVASASSQFGVATTTTRTDKPLIVRLQAPRFFAVGDTVTVSGVLNNNTGEAISATTALVAEGVEIVESDNPSASGAVSSRIPAHANRRVNWRVRVTEPGPVRLAVTVRGGGNSDGMERRLISHVHGIEKLVAVSGKLRGDNLSLRLSIPPARERQSTRLAVQVTPSVAVTMLDALPYLIDYPYGCTEQTMSRFLPTAITARVLGSLGLERAEVLGRVFGGIETEHTGSTQPRGVRDLQRLDDMVNQGLGRLYDFQHTDGGWGWWKGGESDHFMTAYVVWGMALARDAGITVRQQELERGVQFLHLELVEEQDRHDIQAWMLHALAVYSAVQERQPPAPAPARPPRPEVAARLLEAKVAFEQARAAAFENLWRNRDRLNAYSRALLALSAHELGLAQQALVLVRNLENGVIRDDRPDISIIQQDPGSGSSATLSRALSTAHWGKDGGWWRWSDGAVETTSFALRALLAIDPGNELVEPATSWLIKNRRGAQWSNTRDTAIAILALNDYLQASGELQTDIEYELLVNGTSVARQRVTGEDILAAPSQFLIDPGLIADGDNDIAIVRHDGDGPLYLAAQVTFFSREEPIAAAGNEIFLRRRYARLIGHQTLLNGYRYERQPLLVGDTLTSGERIEVVITIEAKNDYEYLVLEDLKPAGLEAVALRSGGSVTARELKSGAVQMAGLAAGTGKEFSGAARDPSDYTGRTRWVYQELRDRKVALFLDKLPQGLWEIRYQLRAEVPGEFHALPLIGQAMYVPEIRANSQELRLRVVDGK